MNDPLFTADPHFGHTNIIKYCNRPFADVDIMNEVMIRNWNEEVKAKDLVYVVGDFGWYSDELRLKRIRDRLNGDIILIQGNHDKGNLRKLFKAVLPYLRVTVQGQEIILFHYAMRTWHHDLKGTWHLYGHSHGRLPGYGKSFDVGVDCWDFRPVSFDIVKREMAKREIGKHPGFDNYDATHRDRRCDKHGIEDHGCE